MQVSNKIGKNNTVKFKNLSVGNAYYDKEGILCVKTTNSDWNGTSYGMCMAYIDNAWQEEEEYDENECIPLKSELSILGYR